MSDAGYLLITGRLGVSRNGDVVGEVSRGEVVGELLGVLEAAPRSATVMALRDSSLARFELDAFRTPPPPTPT